MFVPVNTGTIYCLLNIHTAIDNKAQDLGYRGSNTFTATAADDKKYIITVKKPYDLAGTSVMLCRYLSAKQDVNFSYIPAIRRVRRMTPANRSDGFLGSGFTQDDMAGYDGKTPAFEWKLVGEREVLAGSPAQLFPGAPEALTDPLRT